MDELTEQYSQLFIDLEQARVEMLKADARVAEAKRAFHDSGISITLSALHSLYAAQNTATLHVQELKVLALQAKQRARALKGKTFVNLLAKKATDAGFAHLVEEAKEESLKALDAAGLRAAYAA